MCLKYSTTVLDCFHKILFYFLNTNYPVMEIFNPSLAEDIYFSLTKYNIKVICLNSTYFIRCSTSKLYIFINFILILHISLVSFQKYK